MVDIESALRAVSVMTGIALCLDTLELVTTAPSWLRDPLRAPSFRRMPALGETLTLRTDVPAAAVAVTAMGARLLAGVILVSGLSSLMATACGVGLAATAVLGALSPLGGEGSDHMTIVLLLGLLAAALVPTHTGHLFALWFLALEACLAYFAAGAAKLFGREWRRGTAMATIMNTAWGGYPRLRRLFQTHRSMSRAVTYAALAFELSFPLVLVAPAPMVIGYLVIGVAFHLAIAATMGLNIFFLTFVATYPALAAVSLGLGLR